LDLTAGVVGEGGGEAHAGASGRSEMGHRARPLATVLGVAAEGTAAVVAGDDVDDAGEGELPIHRGPRATDHLDAVHQFQG